MKNYKTYCCDSLFLLIIAFLIAGGFFVNHLSLVTDQYRGHVSILSRHFDDLRQRGYQVDDSQVDNQEKSGPVTESEILIWRVRNQNESEWVEYEWELMPITEETLGMLQQRGIPVNNWWESGITGTWSFEYPGFSGIRSILLPANEAALEIHKDLGLRLPSEFHLQPSDENSTGATQ